MQQHHAEMVAVHNAEVDRKPSVAERAFYAQRADAVSRRPDPKKLRRPLAGQSLMIPHLLRSGIFSLSEKTAAVQRRVPRHDDVSNVNQGACVEYKGARLRQYDMRVLLGIMQMVGGLHWDEAVISFHADDFLALIGKKPSTDAVEALRDSLASLRSATFVVRNFTKDRGIVFGFIDSAVWEKRKCVVKLNPLAHSAVDALGFQLLPMTARNRLSDGIQTAMADVICSSSADSFDVFALAAIFGREAEQFGRELRSHMPALVQAGVLKAWSHTRGRLHIERVKIS